MLDALRRGAQTWLAKILFGILIISFGVFWNIEDVFRGGGRGSIAKVGDNDVTIPDFQKAMQDEIAAISRRAGKRITPEEARAAGLDGMVLKRLINDTALASHAKDLKLAISDDVIADNLKRDENLQGPDGKFSKAVLDEVMRSLGLNERGLFAMLRKDELKKQLLAALSNSVAVPQQLLDVQHAWSGEKRVIQHFTIDAASVKPGEPDEKALNDTYESQKRQFMVPEYRKLAVLLLTADDLKKEMTVTDDEIKTTYEKTKDTYDVPEKRRVQQIAFKDKAAADEAKKALAGGKSFRDVAKDAGATETDINLGLVTKKQMLDKIVAEKAFTLKRDEVSDVIEGRFKPVIIRIVEIQTGKESTLAEVQDKIKDKLSIKKAEEEIQKHFELVEEQRNLGKTLKEVSESLKLRFMEIEGTDRFNKRPDGGRAVDHPDERKIVESAFSGEKGLAGDAVELKQANGYAWIDVLSVIEEKQKSFDEAKTDVKAVYMDMTQKTLIDELATKLAGRADAGEDFAKLAEEAKGKVELTEAITRTTVPPGLDEEAMQKAFTLVKGKAGTANTSDRKSRVVFRVIEITPAPTATQAERDKLANEVRMGLTDDQLEAYVRGLSSKLGVTINEAEFKRATGVTDAQP